MVASLILDLVERVWATPVGATVELAIEPGEASVLAAWCVRSGNELVSATDAVAVVRRGPPTPPPVSFGAGTTSDLPVAQRPGARLWLYTNFDCNLACDYCCARSSPKAPRRAIGVNRIRRLVTEGANAGVTELFLTGGEPFLLPDLDQVVAACVPRMPTTLLTNGMLFRGRRLSMLRRMPRDGLTLQISLDSASAQRHDRHRGAGTWQRALDGIALARAEGFRVRVAATLAPGEAGADELAAWQVMLDGQGIDRAEQIVRPVARRGFANDGVALTVQTLLPEVTVTADGIYWHPVGADHPDQLVTTDLFPLAAAIDEVHRRFAAYRRHIEQAAQSFPCA